MPEQTLETLEQHLEKSRQLPGFRRSSRDAGPDSGDAGVASGESVSAPGMPAQLHRCQSRLWRLWSSAWRSRGSSRDTGTDSPAQDQTLEILEQHLEKSLQLGGSGLRLLSAESDSGDPGADSGDIVAAPGMLTQIPQRRTRFWRSWSNLCWSPNGVRRRCGAKKGACRACPHERSKRQSYFASSAVAGVVGCCVVICSGVGVGAGFSGATCVTRGRPRNGWRPNSASFSARMP